MHTPNLCFFHIPKTAGTTSGFILDYAFGRQSSWDYKETYCEVSSDRFLFLNKGISLGMIRLYGGHVTYKSYEKVIQWNKSVTMATFRDPLEHFISKYNHDFNVFVAKNKLFGDSLTKDAKPGQVLIEYSKVSKSFNINNLFRDDLKDYLFSFLSDCKRIVNIDFLVPTFDIQKAMSLFFFRWNYMFPCHKIARRDPAFMAGECFPKLNESGKRLYQVAFSNAELEEIKNFVSPGYQSYQLLLDSYNKSVCAAVELGFKHHELPTVQFK